MTRGDASLVKKGDWVEKKTPQGWVPVLVLAIQCQANGEVRTFCTRRPGITRNGRPYPSSWIHRVALRRKLNLDDVTSNVFADFLDEKGEYRAATLLREAFPLVQADGTAGPRESVA